MLDGTPVFEGKWYDGASQVKRRLGRAWLVADDGTYSGTRRRTRWEGWLRRSGRPAEGFMGEEDAWSALRRAQALYATQQARSDERRLTMRFEDAAQAWLAERATIAGWKPTTLRNYATMLGHEDDQPRRRGTMPRARIMRAFGGRRVDEISQRDVRAFLRELDKAKTRAKGEGKGRLLSARSVNAHRQVLSMVFAYAVEQGWREDNPVAATSKRRERDERELVVFTIEQLQAIARAAVGRKGEPDEMMAALILTAGMTGLRLGELLELRWRDVHFAQQTIHVQRSYSAGLGVTTPKGRRGRSVPMADQLVVVLDGLSRREEWTKPGDLVFAGRLGGHLDPTTVRKRYAQARDAAASKDSELPALRFHDLRHSFGSNAARAGMDVVWIKATMGHADLKTTMRYLHHRPAADDAARLTRAFGGAPVDTETETAVTAGT
jgi:integrase